MAALRRRPRVAGAASQQGRQNSKSAARILAVRARARPRLAAPQAVLDRKLQWQTVTAAARLTTRPGVLPSAGRSDRTASRFCYE